MKNCKPTVVITDISERPTYYQWFLYGFMMLAKKGEIRLKWKIPFSQRLTLNTFVNASVIISMYLMRKFVPNIAHKFFPCIEHKSKNILRGYVLFNGQKKSFCVDSADAPFLFVGEALRNVDTYFKMQCPKEFKEEGFPLGDVFVPYTDTEFANPADNGKQRAERKLCPEVYTYNHKIKPLMVGPRRVSRFHGFRWLDAGYKNLLNSRQVEQSQRAMCYFGNAKGPIPDHNMTSEPDWDAESQILAYFGNRIHHPNEKREKLADIMASLGDGYDARIINRDHSDSGQLKRNDSLVIPLNLFSHHVAKFAYNVNVSGYRMSIPARFIDSFVCGTAIATDNLEVKWYHPFGQEVVELGEMGYLLDEKVDYDAITARLKTLKPISKQTIIDTFEKYWSPICVAEYMVNTVMAIN